MSRSPWARPLASSLCAALLLSACGGGGDAPPTTTATADAPAGAGTASATPTGQRRMRALGLSPGEAALAKWGPVIGLSLVPAAGAVLPDGKVLLWSADGRTTFDSTRGGNTFTALFDPATGRATERDVRETGHDMFCPGTAYLPDGRLMVNGGIDTARTSFYTPATNSWSTGPAMKMPRAYNASTPLADGSVLTLGGSWADRRGGKVAEVWSASAGWRLLPDVPYQPYLLDGTFRDWQSDAYPFAFSTANGRVLVAGPSPNMGWIDTRGNGRNLPAGRRGDDSPSYAGNFVMYEAGKILKTGGATWNGGVPASAAAYLIDTTQGTAAVKKLAPMGFPRVFANSVVLPNGQVLVVGGQTYGVEFSDANAVLAPELWDPETERFTPLPPLTVPRNYHAVALLLPDARVVAAGGGLSGGAGDHPDLQILSPPYLFNSNGTAATRPVITAAPATVLHGTRVAVTADSTVAAFSMVRLGAATHSVNNDQRRVSLSFTREADGSYRIDVPSNPGILLPGPWMLFAMNAQGTPSVAKIVTVSRSGSPTLENPGDLDLTLGVPVNQPITASTPAGTLRFSADRLPAGLVVDPTTGAISGAPVATGSSVVTLKATNDTATISTDILINVTAVGTGTGLTAQYFAGSAMAGNAVVQRTEAVDFDWTGRRPDPAVPAGPFSARWTGWIEAVSSGPTTLRTVSDDGVRVWIDDRLVIDNWTGHAATNNDAAVSMVAGRRYRITMEYFDGGWSATARLLWQLPSATGFVPVPATRLYPAAAPSSTNLALGRAAGQSTTMGAAAAGRAVDGNLNGSFGAGSVTHTNGDARPWWQVDLGAPRRVDLVQLWNRSDCCTERLNNFVVYLSASDMSGRSLDQLNADASVLRREVGATNLVPTIGVPLNGIGRYVRVQLLGTNALSLAEVQVFGGPAVFNAPVMVAPGKQQTVVDTSLSLPIEASDPDANPLRYEASGLPPGLAINADTGRISGTPSTPGLYTVTVSAANDGGRTASASFTWQVLDRLPSVEALPATMADSGSTVSFTPTVGTGAALQYRWNFGDGSGDTAWSSSPAASHRYTAPGIYTVTLLMQTADGRSVTQRFVQAVKPAGATAQARSSSPIALEPRSGQLPLVWVVNPDNDSVSVIDAATGARVAEIAVGNSPRTLARAADGRFWVVNRGSASLSIVNPATRSVVQTVPLPRASQPHAIVFAPSGGAAFVSLEATGQVLRLDGSSAAVLRSANVGPTPRHMALSAAGDRLLVARYITRPLPGEGSERVQTSGAGAEVLELNPADLSPVRTVVLGHSERTDSEAQGRGIPNYLGAPVISPDGRSAWVPSKQDNILRGMLRSGQPLDFQNTVRAVSSRIDLVAHAEDLPARIDHDNSSLASALAFHPSGSYLFAALETSRQVAVLDAAQRRELFRFEVGLAPQGMVMAEDGLTLYVQDFMSRSVSAIDLRPLVQRGQVGAVARVSWPTVAADKLAPQVLLGKQLFYDARDTRLARDSYMSCATCHQDGGHDGRTWDLTGFGEGLRNTIALRGRAGTGHGFLHWSANFDEVQDFEKQIRELAGGSGLMTNEQYNAGTRNQALGDRKAGQSADLDALAAYVASLSTFDPSPWRSADGRLTAAAQAGAQVFKEAGCASCHKGQDFTTSSDATALKDVGTLNLASGRRLGGALGGIDVPALRDVWATAPYLHNGSAASLADAVRAHRGNTVEGAALDQLVAYLQQIGSEEPGLGGVLLSTGKAATQSSLDAGGLPGRAVDGRTDGVYVNGSISHTQRQAQPWWQVDLGATAAIDVVRLWNRTDCCIDRLQDVYVLLSATDMTGRSLAQLLADPGVAVRRLNPLAGAVNGSVDFAGQLGRYVRVQLGVTEVLSLAEVQVYGAPLTLRALAPGRPATQSSIDSGGLASRAVDGNTNGVYASGSVSHTANEAQPWWQVDLGASADIRQIVLWNRTDCCTERLSNLVVLVSEADMTGRSLAELMADPTVTKRSVAGLGSGASSLALSLEAVRGRHVRVQLNGTGIMSLAEVQVFGL